MGYGYAVAREGVTPVADATLLAGITDTAAVNEIVRINEIFLGGEATASAVNRYVLRRATTVGSLPTAQTPAELSSSGPAAQTAWATTWGTQPITASAPAVFVLRGSSGRPTSLSGKCIWNECDVVPDSIRGDLARPVARGETIPTDRVRFLMPGYEGCRFYTRPDEDTGTPIVGFQWYNADSQRVLAEATDLPPLQGSCLEAPLGDQTLEQVCWHLVRITLLHEAGEFFVVNDTRPWNPHEWIWWKEEEQDRSPGVLQPGHPRA
jgi:hypothetical protein